MINHDLIQNFINEIAKVDEIIFVPTDKNKRTRLLLGLTVLDCEEIIKGLTVSDYIKGPEDDHDPAREGKVWIFKTNYDANVLYIKLKEVEIIRNNRVIRCLSCHIDNMIL